jgi:nicotinate-nucleotide pyrophosphorylase (carboxylating)
MEQSKIDAIVQLALNEDIGDDGDITASLLDAAAKTRAVILSQQEAIFCGRDFAAAVFKQVDAEVVYEWLVADGDAIAKDQVLCRLYGAVRSLLTSERIALNFLQTLSSTATLTHDFVKQLAGTKAKLLDTRKTLPGLRLAQKYAVLCGGGKNHRFGLYDAILIKENHIAACGGSLSKVVAVAKSLYPDKTIEVEVRNLNELEQALSTKANIIMLDNFSLTAIQQAVELNAGKVKLEASGGINLGNIHAIAETGVDYISVGAITKTVIPIELTMLFEGLVNS